MTTASDNEDFEYCGGCCVCNKTVDHSKAGCCEKCAGIFHWNECGDWGDLHRICDNCAKEN